MKQIETSLLLDSINEVPDREALNPKNLKIADIQFSYDNADLIKLLRERGEMIA